MIASPPNLFSHIRKLDISRDLDHVADLVELCFPIQSDPDGQTFIHEMRKTARDVRLLGWLNDLAENGSRNPAGFVWEEDGKILGNLSLIPFQEEGRRIHLIANVAVHPDHRRRGIARVLTQHALNMLRRMGEKRAWLQVREDNPAAIELYESVGFTKQAFRTTWRIRPTDLKLNPLLNAPNVMVRQVNKGDWEKHRIWLLDAYPQLIRWNLPLDFSRCAPGMIQKIVNFLDGISLRQWAFEADGACQGVITWQKTDAFAHNLWLAFPKDGEEQVLPGALAAVLQRSPRIHPLSIDYPKGRFEAQFIALGFEHFRTLIWMCCPL